MILCDANVLIALVDERQSLHAVARRDLTRLLPSGLRIIEPVISETCYLLPLAFHRKRLQKLLDEFHIEPLASDSAVGLFSDVFSWLDRYSEHEPDWADAQLAVLCGYDHRLRVWTYDREFRTIWRRLDRSAIPVVGSDVR